MHAAHVINLRAAVPRGLVAHSRGLVVERVVRSALLVPGRLTACRQPALPYGTSCSIVVMGGTRGKARQVPGSARRGVPESST